MEPEESVRQGHLDEALAALTERVRNEPADPKLRVFLFQLLAVLGDWERAMTQLNVAADLDPKALLMAEVCRPALNSEALRAEIFAGNRAPLLFGEPQEWVGWMVQANAMAAQGHFGAAQELREQALQAAPAIPGTLNGQPFEWVMDSDGRLGPILEALVEGRYFWVPFTCIGRLVVEEVRDLRDLVWVPAHFTWTNGGAAYGLIPTRYPGSEDSPDPGVRLARKTEWVEKEGGLYVGLGQRMLTTDTSEVPILESRELVLGDDEGPEGGNA